MYRQIEQDNIFFKQILQIQSRFRYKKLLAIKWEFSLHCHLLLCSFIIAMLQSNWNKHTYYKPAVIDSIIAQICDNNKLVLLLNIAMW